MRQPERKLEQDNHSADLHQHQNHHFANNHFSTDPLVKPLVKPLVDLHQHQNHHLYKNHSADPLVNTPAHLHLLQSENNSRLLNYKKGDCRTRAGNGQGMMKEVM